MAERDDEFRPLERIKRIAQDDDEQVWDVLELQEALGYDNERQFMKVINLAKTAAGKANMPIREHFREVPSADLFGSAGLVVTKYAAMLIVFNSDPNKDPVAVAQSYFALQCDKQSLEDEKRIRTRLDVATENYKLSGAAKRAGVQDFQRFNGVGISGLYGGLCVRQIVAHKGLKPGAQLLDHAGSEELAANLFRITQTNAALRRAVAEGEVGENLACDTHERIGRGVRRAILDAGNIPPEKLPAAREAIDKTATRVKKSINR